MHLHGKAGRTEMIDVFHRRHGTGAGGIGACEGGLNHLRISMSKTRDGSASRSIKILVPIVVKYIATVA